MQFPFKLPLGLLIASIMVTPILAVVPSSIVHDNGFITIVTAQGNVTGHIEDISKRDLGTRCNGNGFSGGSVCTPGNCDCNGCNGCWSFDGGVNFNCQCGYWSACANNDCEDCTDEC